LYSGERGPPHPNPLPRSGGEGVLGPTLGRCGQGNQVAGCQGEVPVRQGVRSMKPLGSRWSKWNAWGRQSVRVAYGFGGNLTLSRDTKVDCQSVWQAI